MRTAWLVLPLLLWSAPGWALARFEPPRGCYLGAYIQQDGLAKGDYDKFEQATGRRHAVYMDYSAYGKPFPAAWVKAMGARGCAAHIAWEPNSGLDKVRDDDYLRGWAREAAATKVPIFVRFASEMNGGYTPYHGNPALFVNKWRLLTSVLRREAPNVAMVWCVFYYGFESIRPYYPGDDWVDWVGINIYNVYHHNGRPNELAAGEDPRSALRRVYGPYGGRKPVMICEYGVTHRCSVMPARLMDAFAVGKLSVLYESLLSEFPQVKCIQYFSWDTLKDGAAKNDYSLTARPSVLARYRGLIADQHFLEHVVDQTGPAPTLRPGPLVPPLPAATDSQPRVTPRLPAVTGRTAPQPPAPPPAPKPAPKPVAGSGPDERPTPENLAAQARAAKESGDRERACRLARAALLGDGGLVEAYWVLGWSLCELGRKAEAAEVFENLLQVAPTDPRAAALRGVLGRLR
jgi:hypothetical protein